MNTIFPSNNPRTILDFNSSVKGIVSSALAKNQQPAIICIGTDRSTGDSLGPLIGSKLQALRPDLAIYGTLDEPVHAVNIGDVVKSVNSDVENPYIIAVDASLGRLGSVGCLSAGYGSIRPGAAVKKELPPVGNAYITGIVNVGGFMEALVLQSTRLSLVMKMADIITAALLLALPKNTEYH
jgi:putative sporulation protein YyaC